MDKISLVVHDDQQLFEHLCLASYRTDGLSNQDSELVETCRHFFRNFEISRVARITYTEIELMQLTPSMIPSHELLSATVRNANMIIRLYEQGKTFESYLSSILTTQVTLSNDALIAHVQTKLGLAGFTGLTTKTLGMFLNTTGLID